MVDVPNFAEDEDMKELLACLPEQWARREDGQELEIMALHVRAAYGRGYVLGLQDRSP